MKLFKKIMCIGLLAIVAVSTDSCKKLLEEHPQASIVPSFFNSPAGVLGGISGVYNDLRGQWGTEGFSLFTLGGTDEYLQGASNSAPKFFTYNGLQSADMNGSFWNVSYQDINTLNGVLQFGATVNLPDATRKQYLAQAKFLRAFWYFYLVQTFGDVPLHTTFITVPTTSDSRQPMADVYTQIIKDLTDASTDLPAISPATATSTNPFGGKAAAQGVAKYLLAKVYLTRGWSSAAQAGDFASAYNICQDLITNKATYGFDLWQDYGDAFVPANDYGKETMFTSDHSIDTKYGQYTVGGQASGGAAQNLTPWFARWNYPSNSTINAFKNGSGNLATSGPSMMVRDVPNGRPYIRVRPNSPLQTAGPNTGKSYLFDEAFSDRVNDSRYDKTFQTIWMCNLASPLSNASTATNNSRGITYTLTPGLDTAVWYTDHEVAGSPQFNGATPFKGIIIPPSLWNNSFFPAVKKFDDPSRASGNFNDPSTRPVVIFRFSDVYLIGAEAAFKNNDPTNAAALLNVVRQRAAYRKTNTAGQNAAAVTAVTILPGQVTLDFILDERSREFWGEWQRWWDLARTKSLLTRVPAWNPEASPYIKAYHVLRPIPQTEIDLVTSGPPFPQNPGY